MRSQRAENFETAAAGKHHVQNQEVESLRLRQVEALLAGVRQRDSVEFRLQALLQSLTQFLLVLDHQYPHATAFSCCIRICGPLSTEAFLNEF